MFQELRLSDLKMLVKELRAYHNIRGYTRMTKGKLVAELTSRFVLRDGNLYLKQEPAPKTSVSKTPKKKPALSPEKVLERKIYKYLNGLSIDFDKTSLRVLRSGFAKSAGIDMAPHKALFKKIVMQLAEEEET